MEAFNWTCPHCHRAVSIAEERLSTQKHVLWIKNAVGRRTLMSRFLVCPNEQCKKFTLTVTLFESGFNGREEILGKPLQHWDLIPETRAKHFPEYIPSPVLADYKEACLIRDLSPKASATLSRRCLQGMIRDFWQAKPGRLVDEIDQIRERVDPLTWDAIDALRRMGNIGAHMEKDINTIVDVDPDEATLLIGLIETLLNEWYVNREERRRRMGALVEAAAGKKPSK